MKIGSISDLHLHSESAVSDFKLTDDEFYGFLTEFSSLVDLLVINGDFIDIWQARPFNRLAQLEVVNKTILRYPESFKFILENDKILINSGNHDELLHNSFKDIVTYREFETPKGIININHGVHDYFNSQMPEFSRGISWVGGWAERGISPTIETDLDKLIRKILGINLFENSKQIKVFKENIDANDNLIAQVNSHTHYPQAIKFDYNNKERLFLNTGHFNGKNHHYVILDTDTLEVTQGFFNFSNYSKFKKHLLHGDIILSFNKTSLLSSLITDVTNGNYSHSMVYIGHNRVIESTISGEKNGVMISPLDNYFEGNHNLCIIRLYDRSKVEPFIAALHSELGSKYSKGQIVVDLMYQSLKPILRKDLLKTLSFDINPDAEVCSEVILKALVACGYKFNFEYAVGNPTDIENLTKSGYAYKVAV